jgi:hypothetical protein
MGGNIKTDHKQDVKLIELGQDRVQFRAFVVTAQISCSVITQLLNGGEHFLRSYKLLSYSGNYKHCSEPDRSSPHPSIVF